MISGLLFGLGFGLEVCGTAGIWGRVSAVDGGNLHQRRPPLRHHAQDNVTDVTRACVEVFPNAGAMTTDDT
jgi:hypothetical protein